MEALQVWSAPWRVQTDAYPAEYIQILDAGGDVIVEWPDRMATGQSATFDEYVPAAELMASAPLLLWLLAEARWWAEEERYSMAIWNDPFPWNGP